MGGRRTFFSFHYQRDIWRASIVRNSNVVDPAAAAGWTDASLWEEAKRKGDRAVHRLIDRALEGTSVTVVLIGAKTFRRRYVAYEIEQSLARGNGMLGVRVHHLRDRKGKTDTRGPVPALLTRTGAPIYRWTRAGLGNQVEKAALAAGHPCLAHKVRRCVICRFWAAFV